MAGWKVRSGAGWEPAPAGEALWILQIRIFAELLFQTGGFRGRRGHLHPSGQSMLTGAYGPPGHIAVKRSTLIGSPCRIADGVFDDNIHLVEVVEHSAWRIAREYDFLQGVWNKAVGVDGLHCAGQRDGSQLFTLAERAGSDLLYALRNRYML